MSLTCPPPPQPLLVAPPFTCQGSPPIFNLINEGSPNGISLSYIGAPAYATDPFPCGGGNPPAVDPGTGLAPIRGTTLKLSCNPNSTNISMSTPYFYESSTCHFVIYASSRYACGAVLVAPTNSCNSSCPAASNSSSTIPCNSSNPAAAASPPSISVAAAAGLGIGGVVAGSILGALGFAALFGAKRGATSALAPAAYSATSSGYDALPKA